MKRDTSTEINSFNDSIFDIDSLATLDDAALDEAIGGAEPTCGQLSSCPKLECIEKCGVKVIWST